MKKLWNLVSGSFDYESLYAIVNTILVHLPELQQKNLMTPMIQKKLTISNVNIYSNQLGKP